MDDNWGHRSASMRCVSCMWYVDKAIDGEPSGIGRCRRHAPTLGGWPAVMPGDWCGDHKLETVVPRGSGPNKPLAGARNEQLADEVRGLLAELFEAARFPASPERCRSAVVRLAKLLGLGVIDSPADVRGQAELATKRLLEEGMM